MAAEVFIPKLGQTVEEVTLIGWLVEDGEVVEVGQEILEVETDKAVFPVEAIAKGSIHLGPFEAGETVPVLKVVAIIGKPDDVFTAGSVSEGPFVEEAGEPVAAPEPAAPAMAAVDASSVIQNTKERMFASPRARRAAAEQGVDLSRVKSTGYGGMRIAERDVLDYLEKQPKAAGITQDDVLDLLTKAGEIQIDVPLIESVPLSGIRGVIAERMAASSLLTARVTLFMDVDATELVAAREDLKARVAEDWGFAPGYNDLLALVVARALRDYPNLNARLTSEAIEYIKPINIGMAVDTERGLMVPVIRDVDRKSLRAFAEELRALVEQARSGRISPDDLAGGTFTITNLGMYHVKAFTPVINLPETAILGVGAITRRPVEYQGEIALRHMTTLSLVFDHRVVDGAPAARFLQ
ncbi:MAG: 2-oxo acid dehydrogenase subunit E2, partial [Anaerolineaceae bacterium]|nr:2-oxo acid dehydrogenase subunit E2 [Anaerolineaceae bacterium]